MKVSSHAKLSCTLNLVCYWLWRSSYSVLFLHGREEMPRHPKLDLDLLALDEYRRNKFAPRLMPCEELTLLGTRQPKRHRVTLLHHSDCETVAFVRETEKSICNLHVVKNRSEPTRPFPLHRPTKCAGLELKVHEDIKESYRTFCNLPFKEIAPINEGVIDKIKEKIRMRRDAFESSILKIVLEEDRPTKHRLSQLSERMGTATSIDILRMVYDESIAALYKRGFANQAASHLC
jgi:hypothetical protein